MPNDKKKSKNGLLSRRAVLKAGAASLTGFALADAAQGQQNPLAQTKLPNQNTSAETATMSKRGRMTGKRAMIEQLIADGVKYIFGNPGSTEQGFMDALADYPNVEYILALHEGVAVSMADAYARVTRRPAFVQLHTAAGLGNAAGMLYNALVTNTPLVIYAGINDSRVLFQEPNLSGPLVEMARPVTKWASQIENTQDVPQALRRAFKLAAEPPAGPVFLSIPIDALDGEADVEITPTVYTGGAASASSESLNAAAELLLTAKRPMIMVGDAVGFADAQREAATVAEIIGAPLFEFTFTTRVNIPASHPLNMGSVFYVFEKDLRETLKDCDVLLAVGTRLFPVTYPEPGKAPDLNILPPTAKLIQIDTDAWQISKNIPAEVAMLANPKLALGDLANLLKQKQTQAGRSEVQRRTADVTAQIKRKRDEYQAKARANWDKTPITAPRLMAEIKAVLPPNATVFADAVSNDPHIEAAIKPDEPLQMIGGTSGPGLGSGLPGTIGAQLALPERKLVGIVSDGNAMYAITALWTAAHHQTPVTYIIVNNRAYHVLKTNLIQYYGAEKMRGRKFVGMDLTPPDLRFDRIAESMGVQAWHVEKIQDLPKILREAFAQNQPTLVNVIVDAPFSQ